MKRTSLALLALGALLAPYAHADAPAFYWDTPLVGSAIPENTGSSDHMLPYPLLASYNFWAIPAKPPTKGPVCSTQVSIQGFLTYPNGAQYGTSPVNSSYPYTAYTSLAPTGDAQIGSTYKWHTVASYVAANSNAVCTMWYLDWVHYFKWTTTFYKAPANLAPVNGVCSWKSIACSSGSPSCVWGSHNATWKWEGFACPNYAEAVWTVVRIEINGVTSSPSCGGSWVETAAGPGPCD